MRRRGYKAYTVVSRLILRAPGPSGSSVADWNFIQLSNCSPVAITGGGCGEWPVADWRIGVLIDEVGVGVFSFFPGAMVMKLVSCN